ncbi:MAG: hypothetical protein QM762_25100 [Chryseolinea sp.]
MPKVGNNPILKKVSGMLGDTIVFRQGPDGTVMSNAPKKSGILTDAQITLRSRFMSAVNYGRRSMQKPDVLAMYEAGVDRKRKSAYTVAVSDYLSVPRIHQIDAKRYLGAVGQEVHVHASDDFRVQTVEVAIQNAAGAVVEQGEANLSEELHQVWIYIAKTENISLAGTIITVTARDIPGNVATQALKL